MSDTESVSNLLGDLDLLPLPESAIPLEAILLVKALDEGGIPSWFFRFSDNLDEMGAVGALSVVHRMLHDKACDNYVIECDNDDDDEDV